MEENTDNKVIIPLREQDIIFYEHLAEDIERDFFMSAQEGKEYGIVDHVMPNRK